MYDICLLSMYMIIRIGKGGVQMYTKSIQLFTTLIIVLIMLIVSNISVKADTDQKNDYLLILDEMTVEEDLYETFLILSDNEKKLTIDDVSSEEYRNTFKEPDALNLKKGFFDVAKWIKFDLLNTTDENNWVIEFAFPLIYEIHMYVEDDSGIEKIVTSGVNFPFDKREIDHRHFIFNLDIEPNETKTYYILLYGGGDLHPPIKLWERDAFIENTQIEIGYLGLFYGMIMIMILYNLFIYFSLRIRAYLYYVLSISTSMLAQMSLNGLAFKYLWPNFPAWNVMAVPFIVSITCVFILMFTKEFLDTKRYIPLYNKFSIALIGMNVLTIICLFISHYVALNLMFLSTFSTFATIITVGFISLIRGVREARFFVIGWLVFLTGVFITILVRAAVIPYTIFTEYAGQGALAIEVVLLSLALADKINMMREEKEEAEKSARENQELALKSLKEADVLKDEFLAITSHELRTPLHGMIGIAESLRDGIAGNASQEMRRQLNMIISSGERLAHLVNDILDFSKLKHDTLALDLKRVHLSGLVDAVFTICQPLLKNKPLKLINRIPSEFPSVTADQDRLQQIMYNLIGNAIKYTDIGEVVVTAELLNEKVTIYISDTGKGIAPELQKEIFEPFKQGNISLSREVGGTGIGLSVTKQLVKLHGGQLSLESTVGIGSTFSFTLPIGVNLGHQTDKEQIAVTLEPVTYDEPLITIPKIDYKQEEEAIKVLVADDEPVNLQVLMNQLTLEGMEVMETTSSEKVLQIVDKHPIDVLILDVMMPHMSGYEVCEQLRKTYSLMDLPILMLTAKSQLHDKITAFEVGANDYVTKPCDKEELLSRVKTLANLKRMNHDLTTLNKELEEKVKDRTKALKSANRDLSKTNKSLIAMAESRRNLLANIAHELGTPVTLIHSYVQALQGGLVSGEDEYYQNLVDDKIKVLDRLINDLSDLSRLEEGRTSLKFQTYDLHEWLTNIYQKFSFNVRSFGRIFNKDDMIFSEGMFNCSVDVERMDQVLYNIVSNAAKNTSEENGVIGIKSFVNEQEDAIIIAIYDNGNGISDDVLPNVFERFYKQSIADDYSGTGLGLAIVKEIIQGHHGKVWAESELNIGSTFYISLPVEKSYVSQRREA